MNVRALVVCLSCVGALSAAGPAHAAFPGDNGSIAFMRSPISCPTGGCVDEVRKIGPTGGSDVFVTNGAHPAWSPDGQRLAFVDGSDIYTVDPDGGDAQLVLEWSRGVEELSWSPGGDRMAAALGVCDQDECRTDIHVIELGPGGAEAVVNITPDPLEDRNPDWSPSGDRIAFGTVREANYDVFAIDPDGTDPQRLTTDSGADRDPNWNPSGDTIAFTSTRDGTEEIYTMSPEGTRQARRTGSGGFPSRHPAWSPDGALIVFSGVRENLSGLFAITAGGQSETRLTGPGTGGFDLEPDWQPFNGPPGFGYVRPRSASPHVTALVPAYSECSSGSAAYVHGPPLAYPSCTPSSSSSDLTVGTPDANGAPAKSRGDVRLHALVGNPLTADDEADFELRFGLADVRKTDLSDYAGELEVRLDLRITDRGSDSSAAERGATMIDIPLTFPGSCTPTGDTTVGGQCGADTTLDSIVPNAIKEGHRSILELDRVQVRDGGPDGSVSTEPNNLFMTQGIFVP